MGCAWAHGDVVGGGAEMVGIVCIKAMSGCKAEDGGGDRAVPEHYGSEDGWWGCGIDRSGAG